MNSGPLAKQPVFVITELSIHPLRHNFKGDKFTSTSQSLFLISHKNVLKCIFLEA